MAEIVIRTPRNASTVVDMGADLYCQEAVAQFLIDNGAHMDLRCRNGFEATHIVKRRWPKWNFNKSLRCLAARAILEESVPYDRLPKQLVAFIEAHKRPEPSAEFRHLSQEKPAKKPFLSKIRSLFRK